MAQAASWLGKGQLSLVTLTRQKCRRTMASMSKCPTCRQEIATPGMFNLLGWAEFACPHCRSRLEAKAPSSTSLAVMMTLLFGLGRESRIFEVIAVVFVVVVFALFLIEAMHPRLRLKKPLPAPAIRLNIAGNEQ